MWIVPLGSALLVAAICAVGAAVSQRNERRALREHADAAERAYARTIAALAVPELKRRIRESRYFAHAESGRALRETHIAREFLERLEADDFARCRQMLAAFAAAERSIGCAHPPLVDDFDFVPLLDELGRRVPHPFR